MTIIKHELKQNYITLLVWTFTIAFLVVTCIVLYPEMKGQMDSFSEMFASMGSFSSAFGLDSIDFGSLVGFYSIECGNILGIGGVFFAGYIGCSMLEKEEKDKTAEFLLTNPISRTEVISEKLISMIILITVMNVLIYGCSIISIKLIGESIPFKEINLMHLAFYLMQLETGFICFAISAFIRKSGSAIGLSIGTIFYFLNLIANISDKAKFLKYISPFGYCEGADIINNGSLDTTLLIIAAIVSILSIIIAYLKYNKKDIH